MEVKMNPKERDAGKIVLVVDDSEFLRTAIERAFLSDGFKTCIEAANGEEAIEAARKCQPDLIILDLSMPVMTGLQAAPILRGMFPKVLIFLFTLYADAVSKDLAVMIGVNLVLSKDELLSNMVDKAHELMGAA
jgi:CheY-like chemotaxis protein